MEQYANDFQIEREAREKQQDEISQKQKIIETLTSQKEKLREELNQNTANRMREFNYQQNQQEHFRHPSRSNSAQGNPNARVPNDNRRAQSPHDYEYNRGLYGRGNVEPEYESIGSGDLNEITCPKCGGAQPDRDSLQIHLVECLDDEQ